MVRNQQDPEIRTQKGLIVGNYCHDVLIRDDVVVGESLGGAASFISKVFDGLSVPHDLVAKVGEDFSYLTNRDPILVPNSKTTVFHAYFDSRAELEGNGHQDRVLKRVCACDPIKPSDLPDSSRFDFGMAVGVGGEILPETLEKMLEICDVVFVDIQAIIREFDGSDGTVKLVGLRESGFFHLLNRIGFLKASSEEVVDVDIEEVRKLCCVVITNGKYGCRVYSKEEEVNIEPFDTNQIDPTGAGDSFLGGLVAGLVQGLPVSDAALLGNLFGSLTVGQIGLPKFDSKLMQRIKDEMQRRKTQCVSSFDRNSERLKLMKQAGYEQFHTSLGATRLLTMNPFQESESESQHQQHQSSSRTGEIGILPQYNGEPKLLVNPVFEEPIQTFDRKP